MSRWINIDDERNVYCGTDGMYAKWYIDTEKDENRFIHLVRDIAPSAQLDCSDCIKHGGDWDCDHVHCHKGKWIVDDVATEHCSVCKHRFYIYALFAVGGNDEPPCCPWCGARMEVTK